MPTAKSPHSRLRMSDNRKLAASFDLGFCNFVEATLYSCISCWARAMSMERKFLGVTLRRWIEYAVAILLGNAIYYFSLVPHLPQALRHQGFLLDWGSLTDFVVCLAVYGLLRLAAQL